MIDTELVNRNLRTLIRTLYQMPASSVRLATQNAPVGADALASVQFMSLKLDGAAGEILSNVALSNDVASLKYGQATVAFSVQFFREAAYNRAATLELALQSQQAIDFMRANNMGFYRASAARDLSALVDSEWEQRAQIDIEVFVIVTDTRNLATYGTFPLETTVDSTTVTSEVNDQ